MQPSKRGAQATHESLKPTVDTLKSLKKGLQKYFNTTTKRLSSSYRPMQCPQEPCRQCLEIKFTWTIFRFLARLIPK